MAVHGRLIAPVNLGPFGLGARYDLRIIHLQPVLDRLRVALVSALERALRG
jgi:hypothetical protein